MRGLMFNNNEGTGNAIINDISAVAHDASAVTITNYDLIQDISSSMHGSSGGAGGVHKLEFSGVGAVSAPSRISSLGANTAIKVTLIGGGGAGGRNKAGGSGVGRGAGGGGGGGGVTYWTTAGHASSLTYTIGVSGGLPPATANVQGASGGHTSDSSGNIAYGGEGGWGGDASGTRGEGCPGAGGTGTIAGATADRMKLDVLRGESGLESRATGPRKPLGDPLTGPAAGHGGRGALGLGGMGGAGADASGNVQHHSEPGCVIFEWFA